MTRAYAVIANGGLKVYPYFVTQVDDNGGHVLYRRHVPTDDERERIVASHVNRDIVAMMNGVVTHGTGMGAAVPGHETAGKTGTTQDFHDAWFIGYTHDYVAAVWVGNDDSSPMKAVTGGSLPATIWKATMTVAEKGLPSTKLDKSDITAPADNTMFGDNGDVYTPSSGDEESGPGVFFSGGETGDADNRPPPDAARGDHRTFWDWLLNRRGRDNEGRPQSQDGDRAPGDSQETN
jgi:penicillin-binding protein 1A